MAGDHANRVSRGVRDLSDGRGPVEEVRAADERNDGDEDSHHRHCAQPQNHGQAAAWRGRLGSGFGRWWRRQEQIKVVLRVGGSHIIARRFSQVAGAFQKVDGYIFDPNADLARAKLVKHPRFGG
ncbi:MAG: hypothetical protein HY269_01790, partial [Deltaproteobacteria bacterium]|nr:hypothetical protein [Deltaproteobacteria bacterium]